MRKLQILYVIAISLLILLGLTVTASANMYGAPFDDSNTTSKIISLSHDKSGQIVTLQGVISAQCKGDGCWLRLKDDTGEVMVDLKPYDFRIPMNSSGKNVRLNGRVNSDGQAVSVDAISIQLLD